MFPNNNHIAAEPPVATPAPWRQLAPWLLLLSAILVLASAQAPIFVSYLAAATGAALLYIGVILRFSKRYPNAYFFLIISIVTIHSIAADACIPRAVHERYVLWYLAQWMAAFALVSIVTSVTYIFHIRRWRARRAAQ